MRTIKMKRVGSDPVNEIYYTRDAPAGTPPDIIEIFIPKAASGTVATKATFIIENESHLSVNDFQILMMLAGGVVFELATGPETTLPPGIDADQKVMKALIMRGEKVILPSADPGEIPSMIGLIKLFDNIKQAQKAQKARHHPAK